MIKRYSLFYNKKIYYKIFNIIKSLIENKYNLIDI